MRKFPREKGRKMPKNKVIHESYPRLSTFFYVEKSGLHSKKIEYTFCTYVIKFTIKMKKACNYCNEINAKNSTNCQIT